MNARAKALGLRDTHFANPVGLDVKGNYSTAADLVKLDAGPAPERVLPRDDRPRRVDAPLAARGRARSSTATRSSAPCPFVNGVKTGHTSEAGYVLVGSATRDGVTVVSAVLGAPREAARDGDTLALLRYGLSPLPASSPRSSKGQRSARASAALPRRARSTWSPAQTVAADGPHAARSSALTRASARRRGRRPAAQRRTRSGRSRSASAARRSADVPLVVADAVAGGDRDRAPRPTISGARRTLLLLACVRRRVACSSCCSAAA